jgi:hypothetical protein
LVEFGFDTLDKSYFIRVGYVQNRRQVALEELNKIAKILGLDVKYLNVSSKE